MGAPRQFNTRRVQALSHGVHAVAMIFLVATTDVRELLSLPASSLMRPREAVSALREAPEANQVPSS